MTTATIPEWKVTISLTRILTWPVEDDEDKETFRKWLRTSEGYGYIKTEFLKNMRLDGFGANTDVEIDEIELKENEVSSWDTHPSV